MSDEPLVIPVPSEAAGGTDPTTGTGGEMGDCKMAAEVDIDAMMKLHCMNGAQQMANNLTNFSKMLETHYLHNETRVSQTEALAHRIMAGPPMYQGAQSGT